MRLQQLKQTTLGLLIVGLDEGEASAGKFRLLFRLPPKCQDALAGNYFEISLLAASAYIAKGEGKAALAREFGIDRTTVYRYAKRKESSDTMKK